MPTSRSRRTFGATQKDRIFFACLPDAATATRIHTLAKEQKQLHKFYGTLILPEHLHVTLSHLGDWIKLPVEIARTLSMPWRRSRFNPSTPHSGASKASAIAPASILLF